MGKAGERPVKRTEGSRGGSGCGGGSEEEAEDEGGTSIATLGGWWSLPPGDGGGEGAMNLCGGAGRERGRRGGERRNKELRDYSRKVMGQGLFDKTKFDMGVVHSPSYCLRCCALVHRRRDHDGDVLRQGRRVSLA